MKATEQRRVLAEWRRLAGQGAARRRRLSRDQLGVVLVGMGIGVQGKRDVGPG